MIGIVIVSHSARLAEGVCELAAEMGRDRVRLAPAGGTADPVHPIGTDAFRVLAAIESVYSDDGVMVFTDLGSAVLSAETAIEMLPDHRRPHVHLSDRPVVEAAVAAASLAAAGAPFEEIVAGAVAVPHSGAAAERIVTVPGPIGLHARPAAQLVRLGRQFQARVTLENLTRAAGPSETSSIHALLALAARAGHQVAVRAEGPEAEAAVAAVAAFLEGLRDEPPPAAATSVAGNLAGIPASSGIAVGPLFRARPAAAPTSLRAPAAPETEQQRLRNAIVAVASELRSLCVWAKTNAGETESGIFDAQSLFLEDPALAGAAFDVIVRDRTTAEHAWHSVAERLAAEMDALDDPYLSARAADLRDVAARVLDHLTGHTNVPIRPAAPSILAARDLSPSQAAALDPALVLGVCLETGSASAHSVILVRAMGIPAVVGAGPALVGVAEGATLALDGEQGAIWIDPDPARIAELEARRTESLRVRRAAEAERRAPAATRDGHPIRVLANLSHAAEITEALDFGAEGVGVLRTEFLFLGRAEAPTEDEQAAAYETIAAALAGKPLVIRTLDVGGDKALPYLDTGREANPFLGWRGIRVTLSRRDLLRTQLRAILRVARRHPAEVLFPMISTLAELREAKAVLAEVAAVNAPPLKIGAMIEVPSAVAIAPELAREVDSFSIGTNDLIQYLLAADRTNSKVAALADPFQPAVLRTIRAAISAGREAGIEVTLCGELAADTLATPLLLGLGFTDFSVSPPLIPALKRAIERWSIPEAEAIAAQALSLDSAPAVRSFLR